MVLAFVVIALTLIAVMILDKNPVKPAGRMLTKGATGFICIRLDMSKEGLAQLIPTYVAEMRRANAEGLPPETQRFLNEIKGDNFVSVANVLSPLQLVIICSRPVGAESATGKKKTEKAAPEPVNQSSGGTYIASIGRGSIIAQWIFRNQLESMVVTKTGVVEQIGGIPVCVMENQGGRTIARTGNNYIYGQDMAITRELIDQFKKKESEDGGPLLRELSAGIGRIDMEAEIYGVFTNKGSLITDSVGSFIEEKKAKRESASQSEAAQEQDGNSSAADAMREQERLENNVKNMVRTLQSVAFHVHILPGNKADIRIALDTTRPSDAESAGAVLKELLAVLCTRYAVTVTSTDISEGKVTAEVNASDFLDFMSLLMKDIFPSTENDKKANTAAKSSLEKVDVGNTKADEGGNDRKSQ